MLSPHGGFDSLLKISILHSKKEQMRVRWHGVGLLLLSVFFLQHCANPIAPTGGPRDETPPQLDTAESTSNYQTNFEKQTILLTFDEWVVLQDVFNQVVVSPPLDNRPQVSIRKKTVLFEFAEEEVLRENATYTINFGEAIKDLTEGNPADGLRFVFSTGDFIDSLTVEGKIVDARTGEPVEGALFNMYDELQDTVVRTQRPFYFSKTNKDGRFRIENIKSDTFKVFALKDANLNYLFDQSSESIGFLDTLIILPRDMDQSFELQLFKEEPPLRLENVRANRFGVLRLKFSKEIPRLSVNTSIPGKEIVEEYKKDSLILWYPEEAAGSWEVYLALDTIFADTIQVDSIPIAPFLQKNTFKFSTVRSNNRATTIVPGKPLRYEMNHPVGAVSGELFQLTEDTIRRSVIPTVTTDTNDIRVLKVTYPWREGIPYRLRVLPGAVTDIYGLSLTDTLTRMYIAGSSKDFGILNLSLTNMNPDTNYVAEIYSGGSTLIERIQISGRSEYTQTFQNLNPGKYEVHLIIDLNRNGQWDTGDYDLKRQPEPFFVKPVEQLRANWEVDANIDFSQLE